MDILISSNLERLIFELSDRDSSLTKQRMEQLKKDGRYIISNKELSNLNKEFYATYTEEEDCLATISDAFEEYGYVCDPHTSVALDGAMQYSQVAKEENAIVVLSTASPYKFTQAVLKAVSGENVSDAFKCAEKLFNQTALNIPNQISSLKTKERRFLKVINKEDAVKTVLDFAKN